MAVRYVKQAGNQLDPVYQGAIKGVSSQIPQVNNLYDALVAGLEGQTAGGVQDILASAEARGVGRARLAEDVGTTLGSALDLEKARAGAQQAEDIAGITGNLTDLRTGRVMGRQDLGDSFQDIGLAKAENKLTMNEARKQYQQDVITMNRQAELDKKAAAIQRSRASSSGYGSGGSGGSGGGQSGPSASQREDGGFAFTDAKGGQISAATYAKQTGQPLSRVLGQMAGQGDTYAEAVLRQFAADPFYSKNQKRYRELYPAIFKDNFKF